MSVFSSFAARLRIYPIIQAPMAGVATPELAAAVSNSGGLGSIGIGASSVSQAKEMITRTKALTSKPFNVNVFCHAPALRNEPLERAWLQRMEPLFQECEMDVPTSLNEIYKSFIADEEAFQMLLEERPAVVSFHFGLPTAQQVSLLKNEGICTLATATNLDEARQIQRLGIDAIVAQGIEAGGHRGVFDLDAVDEQLTMPVLVRLLVKNTDIPIIAAGGIMDGQGIHAALELGAAAAQLGTAFILCPESAANEGYRAALRSEHASNTRLTSVFSGRPARGIVNQFIQHLDMGSQTQVAAYPLAYDAAKRLSAAAAKKGNHKFAAHWAGQGAPMARELPAEDLMNKLIEEWRR